MVTGNTVIDALFQIREIPYKPSDDRLTDIPLDKRILLVTTHRRENFGKPLLAICEAIRKIAALYSRDIQIVYPVHLNPNVFKVVHGFLHSLSNITLLEPLDYLSWVHLMDKSHLLLTDSGGLQEEAPSLGKPVLVLRDITERPEAVKAGTVKIVGTDRDRIVEEVNLLLNDSSTYNKMSNSINPYGDGHSAEKICKALETSVNSN